MGKVRLARIDSRLAHSQMVEKWSRAYGIKKVIIANDQTKKDPMRVRVMDLTIPEEISSTYLLLDQVKDFLDANCGEYFLIVENTADLEKIIDARVKIEEVNIGIIHLAMGKKSLTEMVAVDDEDMRIFAKVRDKEIKISLKNLPDDRDEEIKF